VSDERDAIERLERRVAQLETLVRALASRAPGAPVAPPAPAPPPPPTPRTPRAARTPTDLEQLIGQRGLLIVGVLALIATAGFFLKYAFERGWISPELRVVGGVAAGVAIAVLGERLVARGLRPYGAALIGGGGALVYLACWAAAGAYGLVSRPVGTGLLFATTAAVALRAVFHRLEPLTVWALVGAYLAPVFLPRPATDPVWLWGYVALVGITAGALAVRHGWRFTFDIALLGYYLLPLGATPEALSSVTGMAYLSAGGVGALLATSGRPWPEARLGGPALAWMTLLQHTDSFTLGGARWSALAGGATLAAVSWWQGRRQALFGTHRGQIQVHADEAVFVLNPLALGLLARELGPRTLRGWDGLVPLLTAGLYVVPGWLRRTPHFLAMGFALAALAVVRQWNGTAVAVGLALLGAAAASAERWYQRRPGRELAVWLAAAALLQVFAENATSRPGSDPAFVGTWALGWYIATAGALASGWLWPPAAPDTPLGKRWEAWALGGLSILVGGSIELRRFFHGLAGDLSISAFWIVYAGALVQLGFWRGNKMIRTAGLAVAGLAVCKIAFYDLSNLEALYRVGSFFILALITLAVAYAYHKKA
jgi:uncharacterized membrane protein